MLARFLYILLVLSIALPVQAASPYGRFHALVIGNQKYRYLKPLKTPRADAQAVKKILEEKYGFKVQLLLDAKRYQITRALNTLRETMREKDNLLIYYAGHGFLDQKLRDKKNVQGLSCTDLHGEDNEKHCKDIESYWLAVDAEPNDNTNWISSSDIINFLKAVDSKHVLIVADACFSGVILMRESQADLERNSRQESREVLLQRMWNWKSRNALTSGAKETVRDTGGQGLSIFAEAFVAALRENQDVLESSRILYRISEPVVANSHQTPLYGPIQMVGHQYGDFILVPRALQEQNEPPVVAQTEQRRRDDFATRGKMPQQDRTIGQYIDHGDGTVTDTKTGLMWKRCSEGLSGDTCEHGKVEKYRWYDAMQRFKNVAYAGYTDWRLPTIDELKTLVYCRKRKDKEGNCKDGSEAPKIKQQAFPNNPIWFFWSGSPYAGSSVNAWWYVNFFSGNSYANHRDISNAVRLVRGGQ
ncbi:MAG: DUF1566 domain-containing protein [Candidatus Electrothrix sp. MAN1_4]|nr:DUF1566 domain-containing protein [Candidatus Electrothrix sp. MAN1_4]